MKSNISIPLSKIKLFVFLVIGTLFVVAGWYFFQLTDVEISSNKRFNNIFFVHSVGLSSMIFFGLIALWIITKIFDDAPGLVLSKQGIFENTNMFSIGFVAWADVSSIQVRQIKSQRIIYVVLKDPEKYISTCGPIKQILLRSTLKLGPSPVTIISNSLTIGVDEVVSLVSDYLSKYGNT